MSARDRALDRLQRATAEAFILADANPNFRDVACGLDTALDALGGIFQTDPDVWLDEARTWLEAEGLL